MEEERQSQHGSSTCSSRSPVRTMTAIQPASHHSSTPLSRNKHPRCYRRRSVLSYHLILLTLLICCLPLCSASLYSEIEERLVEPSEDLDVQESIGSALERLAKSGVILVDQSPHPRPLDAESESDYGVSSNDLRRRDDPLGDDSTSSSTSPKSTAQHSSSSPTTTTSAAAGIATATSGSMSALPTPFDSGFSSNLSATCSSFMNDMLANAEFKQCVPFSLLLQNSLSFFQAEKSIVKITQTLDASCAANVTSCTKLMTSFASNITQTSACSSDLSSKNPLIVSAQLGLQAYKPMYQASCLRNPSTNAYCFADAITNSSNPSDSFIYHLPLNVTLPGGSMPTCNNCLQQAMAVFEAASSDRAGALASDYVPAAMQVNAICGPTFVNASLAAPIKSGAQSFSGSNTGMLLLVLVVASWLL
ncbi:hypothetical protein LCER1_G007470 [Lachnellula cervina]|uniref:DUF7729 domain-containing protein n=1 Tax=Lachnellula cervina TaxID=1316786 RepID=A0A7D8YKV1_9HELO|nr:hypothetical protein LCER1_G007470 [Lachnellula cervina]